MRGSRPGAAAALALTVAFAVHAALGASLEIAGCRPNLAAAALLVVCMFSGPARAAGFGLLVGVLEAGYAAGLVGSYIVSRTLVAYVVGSLEARVFRDSAAVAAAIVLLGTLALECVFAIFAPPPSALSWVLRTGGTVLANGALAPLLYFCLRPVASDREES
ncbi:MAG TPA: rod shape-determining protein MreD [Chthonomonadales bacterium]|nr:rod shape-determining protein MreD [Chthonomonadales bacterium]